MQEAESLGNQPSARPGLPMQPNLYEDSVSRLETGEQEPGLFIILRLCRAFEIAPGELLAFCASAAEVHFGRGFRTSVVRV